MEIAVDFTELRGNDPIEFSLIDVFFFSVFPIPAVPFPVDLRHIPAHAEIPADDKDFLPVQIEIRPIRVENQIWSSNVISVELHNVAPVQILECNQHFDHSHFEFLCSLFYTEASVFSRIAEKAFQLFVIVKRNFFDGPAAVFAFRQIKAVTPGIVFAMFPGGRGVRELPDFRKLSVERGLAHFGEKVARVFGKCENDGSNRAKIQIIRLKIRDVLVFDRQNQCRRFSMFPDGGFKTLSADCGEALVFDSALFRFFRFDFLLFMKPLCSSFTISASGMNFPG